LVNALVRFSSSRDANNFGRSSTLEYASLYDAYMSVDEPMAAKAVEVLGQHGIDSGYSGACGVAALLQLQTDPALAALKEFASLTPDSTVMAIVTEGMLVSS
jgi:cysteine synthase